MNLPNTESTEKDFGKDIKTLEGLPAKTKELLILQDETEKSTGEENAALQKVAEEIANAVVPGPRK